MCHQTYPEIAEETANHHLERTENSYCEHENITEETDEQMNIQDSTSDNYSDSNGREVSLVEKLLEET